MQELSYFLADPAGNITAFVTTPVEQSDYQSAASALLRLSEHGAEQVAFIKSDSRMEMCGLEFCGNAARSFALWSAKKQGVRGRKTVYVEVSGTPEKVRVDVDTDTDHAGILMPQPRSVQDWKTVSGDANDGVLVDLGGIVHLVLWDVPADADSFSLCRKKIEALLTPPALGVMFFNRDRLEMTPVVYVRDVDSTYFEGSCCSGTMAAAAALALDAENGTHRFDIRQPAGSLTVSLHRENGMTRDIFIEGPVSFGREQTILFEPSTETGSKKL